jgi:hypothetical protein
MKKTLAVLVSGLLLAALYLAEFGKIAYRDAQGMPTLDALELRGDGALWDLFYRVRVKIIDGQSAAFDLPAALRELHGREMTISGAVAFRGDGARAVGSNRVAVTLFDLVPLPGMAYGCEILPELSMRWTIVVAPAQEWTLTREQMIEAEARVRGRFRIETSDPYNAAFFIDDAAVELLE